MWIEIKKTYCGRLGSFPKGTKRDMTDNINTAQRLIKTGHAIKCLSPWDENTNLVMREFKERKSICDMLQNQIKEYECKLADAEAIAAAIPDYKKSIELLKGKLVTADKVLKDFAKKNDIYLTNEEKEAAEKEAAKKANKEKSNEIPNEQGSGSEQGKDDGNTQGQADQTGQGQQIQD